MDDKFNANIDQSCCHQSFPNDGQRFVVWSLRNVQGQDGNEACSGTGGRWIGVGDRHGADVRVYGPLNEMVRGSHGNR